MALGVKPPNGFQINPFAKVFAHADAGFFDGTTYSLAENSALGFQSTHPSVAAETWIKTLDALKLPLDPTNPSVVFSLGTSAPDKAFAVWRYGVCGNVSR